MTRSCAGPDHPRSRGVYNPRALENGIGSGSSPLARGLHSPFLRGKANPWIIPARAGFTRLDAVVRRVSHGSSPLARGLLFTTFYPSPTPRIIPARAGFTRRIPSATKGNMDHPRSRGVYSVLVANFPYNEGSSPLARGLRMTRFQRSKHTRIIPARAGFTGASWPHSTCESDHPRSRGVYN